MPEYSDYIEGLTPATGLTRAEKMGMSQGGSAKSWTPDLLQMNRGDWAGTTAFPTTGGTYTGGVPARGNKWRLTNDLSVGGNFYPAGSVIEAAVDNPGATTVTDWIKYAVQP